MNYKVSTLEKLLCEMQSFDAIKDILNGYELHPLQCIDVMKMLAAKRCLVIYATGKGKTLLACAVMKLLWNEDSSRHFIMFVKKDQLIQTPKKIQDACGREVISTAADADSLQRIFSEDYTKYSVLMLTHDCLGNQKIMSELFKVRDKYCGVIIDEAHELNNVYFAQSASMLASVVGNFEYCWALTATPIITDVGQLTKLATIVDKKRFPDYLVLKRYLLSKSDGVESMPWFFIKRDGNDFGGKLDYRGIVAWADPMPHQCAPCGGNDLMLLCKGDGAVNQAELLVELIKERKGRRGLVYVNQHKVREWILPFFDRAGIRFDCINGYTSGSKRAEIMDRFNTTKELDVVVTSVTTAVDLDCDFVIFYEFTLETKQMIGRAHRGLGDKILDIIFIITDGTYEVDYFQNNILARSLMIQNVLKMNYSEMEDAEREIQERGV